VQAEMHTYSGGLGVLAGDMARECADLGVPSVFVTMASREGYVRQEIDGEGAQLDRPDRWDPGRWCQPLPTRVTVPAGGRSIQVRPWLKTLQGRGGFRVPVLLLDTELASNSSEDRALTGSLYGGDAVCRLKQEIVLGLGGLRVLRALGFHPRVYHMNEGHAALLTLDLLREAEAARGRPDESVPGDAASRVRRQCVFTTHTPVKAGLDRFDYPLVRRLLGEEADLRALKRWGGQDGLNMTRLGLGLSHYANGVSVRHADTARKMFPGYPIHAVTNGVHVGTWLHPTFAELYDSILPGWRERPELLVRVPDLAGSEIWECHRVARSRLIDRVRRSTGVSLDPETLTIVFARRMTGYKRPLLLFRDLERMADIASRHRFQLVITGKAHPKDDPGKDAILRIHGAIDRLGGAVPAVFLPNYDMDWAQTLVAGADVWLQTPLPPMEACGTSGMKAGLNGGLNLSPLDGWWAEGCVDGVNGWSFAHRDGADADPADAEALYDRLDRAVLPCYYGEPERWRSMMKHSIANVAAYFTSRRMVEQYATEAYLS